METWITVSAVAFGCMAAGLFMETLRCRRRISDLERRNAEHAGRLHDLSGELARAEERAASLGREKSALSEVMAEAERKRSAEREAEQKRMQEYMSVQFRNLATEVLDEKSRQLHERGVRSFESLQTEGLKSFESLQNDIKAFKERVESIHTEDTRQRGTLDGQIRALHELNRRMSDQAEDLTRALKGNSKVQGDWGEMILETILEGSSLQKGVHYFPQESYADAQGDRVRPDFVLSLPDGKRVIIDSKVSLTAFVDYVNTDEEAVRAEALKRHLASVEKHVSELSRKQYHNLPQMQGASPDFVIMFIPNEPAFMAALQNDSALWTRAYRSGVVISSPTNLFALLKIVDDLWKRDLQNRHALEIARRGGLLLDKFSGFVTTLQDVGKTLRSVDVAYEKAMGQLSTGKGSLVSQARSLRDLGVKASKNLPAGLLDETEE